MGGDRGAGEGMGGTVDLKKQDPNNPQWFEAPKYEFQLQFVWREQPMSARLEARRKAAEEAAAQEAAQAEESGEDLAATEQ
jgi:hypothetical protein